MKQTLSIPSFGKCNAHIYRQKAIHAPSHAVFGILFNHCIRKVHIYYIMSSIMLCGVGVLKKRLLFFRWPTSNFNFFFFSFFFPIINYSTISNYCIVRHKRWYYYLLLFFSSFINFFLLFYIYI